MRRLKSPPRHVTRLRQTRPTRRQLAAALLTPLLSRPVGAVPISGPVPPGTESVRPGPDLAQRSQGPAKPDPHLVKASPEAVQPGAELVQRGLESVWPGLGRVKPGPE